MREVLLEQSSIAMGKYLITQIAELSETKFDLPIQPIDAAVRKWPYPFLAGLAISNDAEFMTPDLLEELLRYTNSAASTSFGRGLSLQVSSSLFFYSASTCSIFSGTDVKSPEAPWSGRATEYLKAGLLDTNHAFGEFDDAPVFVRAHAERAYEWMAKHGVMLPVFSNHGGTNNRQNVGTDAKYHEGDVASSPAYHSDLLRAGGVKFIWTDSKSYEALPVEKVATLVPAGAVSWFSRLAGNGVKVPPIQASIAPKPDPILVEEAWLQDGAKTHTFTRFRGTGSNAPNVSSFYSQVKRAISRSLYARQGGIILYQHFGVLYREAGQCVQTTVEALRSNPAGFLSGWRILEREFHEGRLWIPKLCRFLSYVRAVESISVLHDESGRITITSSISGLTSDDFRGLTIYVLPVVPASVWFAGHELSVQRNGPDETGRYSVTVGEQQSGEMWT